MASRVQPRFDPHGIRDRRAIHIAKIVLVSGRNWLFIRVPDRCWLHIDPSPLMNCIFPQLPDGNSISIRVRRLVASAIFRMQIWS